MIQILKYNNISVLIIINLYYFPKIFTVIQILSLVCDDIRYDDMK